MNSLSSYLQNLPSNRQPSENSVEQDLIDLLDKVDAEHDRSTGGRRFSVKGYQGTVSLDEIITCVEEVFSNQGDKLDSDIGKEVLNQVIQIDAQGSHAVAKHFETATRRKWVQRLSNNPLNTKQKRLEKLQQRIGSNQESTDVAQALLMVRKLGGKNQSTKALQKFMLEQDNSQALEIVEQGQLRLVYQLRELWKTPSAAPFFQRIAVRLDRVIHLGTQRRDLRFDVHHNDVDFTPMEHGGYQDFLKAHIFRAFNDESMALTKIHSESFTAEKYRDLIQEKVAEQLHETTWGMIGAKSLNHEHLGILRECEQRLQWLEPPSDGKNLNTAQTAYVQDRVEDFLKHFRATDTDDLTDQLDNLFDTIAEEVQQIDQQCGADKRLISGQNIEESLTKAQDATIGRFVDWLTPPEQGVRFNQAQKQYLTQKAQEELPRVDGKKVTVALVIDYLQFKIERENEKYGLIQETPTLQEIRNILPEHLQKIIDQDTPPDKPS